MKGLDIFNMMVMIIIAILLESCSSQSLVKIKEISSSSKLTTHNKKQQRPSLTSTNAYTNTSLSMEDTARIWDQLQHMPKRKLLALEHSENNPNAYAWIELALLSKEKKISTGELASKLISFRERFKNHPAVKILPDIKTLKQLQSDTPPRKIALLLPQSGRFKASGQLLYEGFINAYYNDLNNGIVQQIKFYDTSLKKDITTLYHQALNDGAEVIVGPLLKEEVQQLNQITSTEVKTIALNYSDRPQNKNANYFYEFGLLPEDEILQMATHARNSSLSHAIIIASADEWGKRLVTAFSKTWESLGCDVLETWNYPKDANFTQEIARLLNVSPSLDARMTDDDKNQPRPKPRQDFDVIFLFAKPNEARMIVPLIHYYYSQKTPIYADSSSYTRPIINKEKELDGVIVCDIPREIKTNFVNDNIANDRLYAVGQDAYLLSHSLTRLTSLPNFPMYGSTGALSLTLNHQIHRRLPCTTIHHDRIT
jgi:outer membrane PBP1 activator LpoA protein